MKVVVAKPGKFLGGILRMIFGIKKEKESSY
ncbi:MAG: stage V sporulation protein SpoVM [Oscillospiraceae bacterium]|nr:stage V sporulation protein SpoVM [Oscillospiraceae bacterium]